MVEKTLIREFIAEAEEHLQTLEPNLLHLEKDPSNHELMNDIFLATHNIKGTASYVGLAHISNFTHTLESVLDPLRKGVYQATPELIDALLHGLDTLKELIRHLAQGKPVPDTSAAVTRLLAWQKDLTQNARFVKTQTPQSPTSSHMAAQEDLEADRRAHFDPHLFQLDREDCEIFADISSQQLELIRLTVEKLHEKVSEGASGTPKQVQVQEHITTLLHAFRKIQTSAAMLKTAPLDDIFKTQERRLSALEDPNLTLTEDDLHTVADMLTNLDMLIADLTEYAQEDSSLRQAQDSVSSVPPPPEEASPISSRSVEFSRGRYTLRVEAERVDYLLNLVGELVINRARLVQIGKEIKLMYEDLRTGELTLQNTSPIQRKKNIRLFKKLREHFDEVTVDLGRLTNQMQEATMRIRMVPISQVVGQFPRMVRDLSRQAGKEVEIAIYGAETELDKTVIDVIGEPLIHIIRNAIDHGIEMPDERLKHQKPRQGKVVLSAFYEGNQVIIEVQDDGRGIDVQRIKNKALQQQLISAQEAANLQDRDAAHLIFHSGFSTVENVSSLSGRGVGLNVVKRYLEKINGAIELESVPGTGCTFIIKLPLTLAIIPALMVRVRSEIFSIPLISVEEAVRFTDRDLKTIESHKVIRLRERMIPLLDLAELLGPPAFTSQEEQASNTVSDHPPLRQTQDSPEAEIEEQYYGVILSDGFREIGIIVDALFGESDIVIKPLSNELVNVEGISGASIRGDGQVSLVIDAVSLINLAIKHVKKQHRARGGPNSNNRRGHSSRKDVKEYFPISGSGASEPV